MATKRVGYVTDVEGNWDYWQSYIALSSVIEYDSKKNLTFKDDNSMFVFGGDVCDKGNGSIRITRQLVAFKKRYPDRVILILGNRDINKMRWTSELAQTEIDNVDNIPGPYWVKKEAQVTPKQFLTKIAEQTKVPFPNVNTVANRIKWMLDSTMGSAGDFERRRFELGLITKKKHITDEIVAASYVDSVKPNGEMFEFLSLGQLAFMHDGTLFVHGGINKSNLGYVPFNPTIFKNVKEWVEALNEWYKLEFVDWTLKPKWDYQKNTKLFLLKWGEKFDASIQGPASEADLDDKSKWAARGAHRLMDYALPTAKGSVVYAHMFNKLFNCQPIDPEVKQQLMDHGIFRIVTGHQPHGNAPAVNKALDGFELIDCDSSYSDMQAQDNRGKAVSEVVIAGRKVFVNGILHDGQQIKYNISLDENEGDKYIGKRVAMPDDKDGNSFWVKAKLANTPADRKEYLICKVSGFVVSYDYMTKEKLDELIYNKKPVVNGEDVCSLLVNETQVPITKLQTVGPTLNEIINVQFFKDWIARIGASSNLTLKAVEIQSVDLCSYRIRFIKLNAQLENKKGESVSGVVFLRGNSVAVLCILQVDDKRELVVAVRHPRSAIGSGDHIEIPIGMEEHKSPIGVIRNLLQNESGIELETDTPIDLNQYLWGNSERSIYVSPGSCDQGVRFFLLEKKVTAQQVNEILAQSKSESSYETVLIPFGELEAQCNDGNAIIAARLYDLYLKKRKEEEAKAQAARSLDSSPPPSPSITASSLSSSSSSVSTTTSTSSSLTTSSSSSIPNTF